MQFPSGLKHILSDQSSMEVVVSKLEIPLESNEKTRDEKGVILFCHYTKIEAYSLVKGQLHSCSIRLGMKLI